MRSIDLPRKINNPPELPDILPNINYVLEGFEWEKLMGISCDRDVMESGDVSLLINAIRLADAVAQDYELGRHCINLLLAGDHTYLMPVVHWYKSAIHFEDCIWHLERLIKHLRAIRSSSKLNPSVKELVDKKSLILSNKVEKRITNIRHALAHSEKQSIRCNFKGTVILIPSKRGLYIGNNGVTWNELIKWIESANNSAGALAHFNHIVSIE